MITARYKATLVDQKATKQKLVFTDDALRELAESSRQVPVFFHSSPAPIGRVTEMSFENGVLICDMEIDSEKIRGYGGLYAAPKMILNKNDIVEGRNHVTVTGASLVSVELSKTNNGTNKIEEQR